MAQSRHELSWILKRPVRRDIATLGTSHPIINAYKTAVSAMKALPESDPRNWTRQARIHNDFCPHGNWLFLPWHRWYLHYFERICRKLSGECSFALPYWNWTVNPNVPGVFWGGSANPLFDATREVTPNDTADPASVGPTVMQEILQEPNFLVFGSGSISPSVSQTESSFYGRLEGTPHNHIHSFVRGNMATYMSPLDPVFWLHHNMVERAWVQWNFVRQHPNTQDPAWLDREFTEFCDEDGNPVKVTVKGSLGLPIFNYRFDQLLDGQAASIAETGRAAKRRVKGLELAEEREAVHVANAARAELGARIELEVLEREVAALPLTVSVGEPATVPLRLEAPIAALAVDGDQGTLRTLLVFDGVILDFTSDFSVHVFLNHPQAGPETPAEDPHFVGAFSSFHSDDGEHPARGRYVFDLGPVLARLGIVEGQVDVNIVLVPYADEPLPENDLEVQQVELQLVSEIIEVLG